MFLIFIGIVLLEANGQLLNPFIHRANSTTGRSCFSTTDGFRSNGEEWITFSNDWKVKCDNGSMRIIGCVASRRANYTVIPVGETLTVNNFWHKCEYIDDKKNVRYTEEASCPMHGRELKINETLRNGIFEMRCLDNMWDIVGCYYYTESGEAKLLNIGETAQTGTIQHMCEKVANSTSVMYSYEATSCEYNGTIYQKGQTWVNGRIKFECLDKGAYSGVACLTDEGAELKLGESKILTDEKGRKRLQRCFREGTTIYYQVYPCGDGANQKSCTPATTPAATPELMAAGAKQPAAVPISIDAGAASEETSTTATKPTSVPESAITSETATDSPQAVAPHGVNRLSSESGLRSITSPAVLSTSPELPNGNLQTVTQYTERITKECTETSLPTEIVEKP